MVCAAHVPFLLSEHGTVVISMLCPWESDFLERGGIRGNEVLGGEVVFAGLVLSNAENTPQVSLEGRNKE